MSLTFCPLGKEEEEETFLSINKYIRQWVPKKDQVQDHLWIPKSANIQVS